MKIISLIFITILYLTGCNNIKIDGKNNSKKKIEFSENETLENNEGIFYCATCNSPLYKTENNYQSMLDDESFDKAIDGKVDFNQDFKKKTKLKCKNCGTIIGNVWDDGPVSTGNRHCVSKNSLIFKKIFNEK